jgi:hypothetical protein
VLAWVGVMRVGLIFIVVAFVNLTVNGLPFGWNVAQPADRLRAHNGSLIAAQRILFVNLGVERAIIVFAFHVRPLFDALLVPSHSNPFIEP